MDVRSGGSSGFNFTDTFDPADHDRLTWLPSFALLRRARMSWRDFLHGAWVTGRVMMASDMFPGDNQNYLAKACQPGEGTFGLLININYLD